MNRREFLKTAGGAALAGSLIGQSTGPAHGAAQPGGSSVTDFRIGCWANLPSMRGTADEMRRRIVQLAEAGISLMALSLVKKFPDGRKWWYFTDIEEVDPAYPDWDPLKLVIETAHEHGMAVNAMTSCFSVGRNAGVFQKHPEGVAQLFSGTAEPHKKQGGYACAMQPHVQKYLFDLYREMAERYQPDGLRMDAIRTGCQCHCDYCTEEMAKLGIDIHAVESRYEGDYQTWLQTGTHGMLRRYNVRKVVGALQETDPVLVDEELDRWIQWRIDGLTHFVSQLTQYARKHGMKTSADVKRFWPKQVPTGAQDWVRWAREDAVDYLFTMDYTDDTATLARLLADENAMLTGTKPQHWPGLGRNPKLWAQSPEALLEQAEMVRSAGVPGMMIFFERSLTDEDLALLKDF